MFTEYPLYQEVAKMKSCRVPLSLHPKEAHINLNEIRAALIDRQFSKPHIKLHTFIVFDSIKYLSCPK